MNLGIIFVLSWIMDGEEPMTVRNVAGANCYWKDEMDTAANIPALTCFCMAIVSFLVVVQADNCGVREQ